MPSRLEELSATFASDPGNPQFAELADILRQKGEHLKAIEVCLSGLSSNPECAKGRLMLARIYYERSYIPFAVGELKELARQLPTNKSVRKLLSKLAPDRGEEPIAPAKPAPEAVETVAETEFDFGDFDMIEEAEKEDKSK